MRVALLAHDYFPDRAKTAVGVLRYGDHDVAAVIDRSNAGRRVPEFVPDLPDVPVVASMDDVPGSVDALIVGVAPIGGDLEPDWRPDIRAALERGCDVIAGLHDFLADDDEFRALAEEHDADLHDLRRPPSDLSVSGGVAGGVDAEVVLTVGTDCSTGKMTTTLELVEAAREAGLDAGFVPTGQTGVAVAGHGVVVDRVPADFAAGAVEEMVIDAAADRDYVFVEGQGGLVHPAYSGVSLAILHGAMPDRLVLCHEAGRESVRGYDRPLPDPGTHVDLHETVAAPVRATDVVAGALNTASLPEGAARDAVAAFGDAIGAPATDPVRFGVDDVLEAVT